MLRVAVYTARIGDPPDALREPAYIAPGVDYFCGTDGDLPDGSVWTRIKVIGGDAPGMAARLFKVTLHREVGRYDFYLWQDCRYSLAVDPRIFASMAMRYDLVVMRHPFCGSLAAEADEIAKRHLVSRRTLDNQLTIYRSKGFDVAGAPHSSTGFLVRRNDKRTVRFNDFWSEEVRRHGHPRDQMSFDFSAWKCSMRVGYLGGQYLDNPYAEWAEKAA